MRALALAGLIALAFGLGSYYATARARRLFASAESGGGGARARGGCAASRCAACASRRARTRAACCCAGCSASPERSRSRSRSSGPPPGPGWRGDLTFERSFELAPATRKALAELPGELTATLYHDRFDPRARNTRLLLASLARGRAG